MEEYKINEEFGDIENIIKSNPTLFNWFIKNQEMMTCLGLTNSNCEYAGENKNSKVLALMARAILHILRENNNYPNSIKAKNAIRSINNIYNLYRYNISKPIEKQLKLEYVKKSK